MIMIMIMIMIIIIIIIIMNAYDSSYRRSELSLVAD